MNFKHTCIISPVNLLRGGTSFVPIFSRSPSQNLQNQQRKKLAKVQENMMPIQSRFVFLCARLSIFIRLVSGVGNSAKLSMMDSNGPFKKIDLRCMFPPYAANHKWYVSYVVPCLGQLHFRLLLDEQIMVASIEIFLFCT